MLDSIKHVNTEPLNISNLTDTVVRDVALYKIKGVKYVPEKVRISICPDILTEENCEVPIEADYLSDGKIFRTIPSRRTSSVTVVASVL